MEHQWPGAHVPQADAPLRLAYEPGEQTLQIALPELLAYEPGEQVVHALALDPPGRGFAVPAEQSMHDSALD